MRLTDLSNDTSPHQFDGPAEAPLCGTLVSHLRDNVVARGGFPHDPRLVDRTCQRLFTVNVFAQFHCRNRGDGVRVVGCRDQNRINLLFHLIEHLAEVLIPLRSRMFLVNIARPLRIHVAERDEIVAHAVKRIEAAPSLAADTDSGNVQFDVGLVGKGQPAVAENQKSGPGPRRFGQETAAVNSGFHGRKGIARSQWSRCDGISPTLPGQ